MPIFAHFYFPNPIITINHLGTPQELTDDCGNVVWCNYEWAWGGRYTHHYTSQSLNGCAILEHDLQPIRFQGQFYDVETGLHYNRFRYYDSDVGMFIQRDPIGLLGGSNVFAYAPNPVGWVDPWGLNPCNDTKALQKHADDTKAYINSRPNRDMTKKQIASINRSLDRAEEAQNQGDLVSMNKHLTIAATKERKYVGQRMDAYFKDRVSKDPNLRHLTVSKSGQAAPDVYNANKTQYWDLTTRQSWKDGSHQRKYDGANKFGSGTPLYWD